MDTFVVWSYIITLISMPQHVENGQIKVVLGRASILKKQFELVREKVMDDNNLIH